MTLTELHLMEAAKRLGDIRLAIAEELGVEECRVEVREVNSSLLHSY